MSCSGYSRYNPEAQKREKINPLETIYPPLPKSKYDVIYADQPWDYGGKMQYDKSCIKNINIDFEKDIFISAAKFKYPTLKLSVLKNLAVPPISAEDCILFMWTTGPQFASAIELGVCGLRGLNLHQLLNLEYHGDLNIKQLLLYGISRFITQEDIHFHKLNLYLHSRKDAFLSHVVKEHKAINFRTQGRTQRKT